MGAIREDQDVVALGNGFTRLLAQFVHRLLERRATLLGVEHHRERRGPEWRVRREVTSFATCSLWMISS